MEKSKRKELESQIKIAVMDLLRKKNISAAIKSEKHVKKAAKDIVKKFGKSFKSAEKKIAATKPLSSKRAPAKKRSAIGIKKKK